MRNILIIVRRELQAYFTTILGYIIAAIVLLLEGLFFNWWALGGNPKPSTQVVESFFYLSAGFTMVSSVFLTMRLIAEERQTGSLTLLTTSPVKDSEIIIGKWLSAVIFVTAINVLAIYMPLLVFVNGKVSVGHLFSGYLGLVLIGSAASAIGVFGSSITRYQVLAVILSGAMVLFMVLAWTGSLVSSPPLDKFFEHLAIFNKHFVPFQEGIVGLSHIVYYVSITFFFLLAATKVLEARRWR